MKVLKVICLGLIGAVLSFQNVSAETMSYEIDGTHSTLGFAVKHLQVGTTRGGFNDYKGSISFDPDNYDAFKADVTIKASSIDTDLEARDNHLKSDDFFAVETYPAITFTSDRLEQRGEGTVIVGDLTIKGITKTLTIPVQISGPVKSPFGSSVIGITGQTFINRQDFNITWNKSMDSGGYVVGDEVNLIIEIEAHHK
ncbi:MAG: polyisoprenoid-binding protein [Candidatus Omnitrophica bacterium]|nr:polyisoprenoid-binding protein [Candidatus Omnitrophota bacterium]